MCNDSLWLFNPCFGQEASGVLCGSRSHVDSHHHSISRVLYPVCGATKMGKHGTSSKAISYTNIVPTAVLLAIRKVNVYELNNYPVSWLANKKVIG